MFLLGLCYPYKLQTVYIQIIHSLFVLLDIYCDIMFSYLFDFGRQQLYTL